MCTNICNKKRQKRTKNIFEEIMAINYPNMMNITRINTYTQEAQFQDGHTKTSNNQTVDPTVKENFEVREK